MQAKNTAVNDKSDDDTNTDRIVTMATKFAIGFLSTILFHAKIRSFKEKRKDLIEISEVNRRESLLVERSLLVTREEIQVLDDNLKKVLNFLESYKVERFDCREREKSERALEKKRFEQEIGKLDDALQRTNHELERYKSERAEAREREKRERDLDLRKLQQERIDRERFEDAEIKKINNMIESRSGRKDLERTSSRDDSDTSTSYDTSFEHITAEQEKIF